jgi:hypothetical protein
MRGLLLLSLLAVGCASAPPAVQEDRLFVLWVNEAGRPEWCVRFRAGVVAKMWPVRPDGGCHSDDEPGIQTSEGPYVVRATIKIDDELLNSSDPFLVGEHLGGPTP